MASVSSVGRIAPTRPMIEIDPTVPAPGSTAAAATSFRKLTQAELRAEAQARFGDDPRTWAFQCPNCGDAATVQDFIEAGADPNRVGQECIGRSLGALKVPAGKYGRNANGRGCDWVAYGLIGGPWEIVLPADGDRPERSARSFALAAAVSQ